MLTSCFVTYVAYNKYPILSISYKYLTLIKKKNGGSMSELYIMLDTLLSK